MSSADQKEALRRLLIRPARANQRITSLSNRQLRIIGVTHRTIGKWREELKAELAD